MTTPGITPPEDVYVPGSGFGSQHRGMTVEGAKAHLQAPFANAFGGLGGILMNLINGVVGVVAGAVTAVAGAVGGLFESLGNLLSGTSRDLAKIEGSRAAAEEQIVARMGDMADQLDASVRFGAAYMSHPYWRLTDGDNNSHTLPINKPFSLHKGTSFLYPVSDAQFPEDFPHGHVIPGGFSSYEAVARRTGSLVLEEGGLWFIFFQAAGRYFNGWNGTGAGPTRVWAYVTSASDTRLPQDAIDGPTCVARDRITGLFQGNIPVDGFIAPGGYGRATSWTGTTTPAGGYTTFGMMPVMLPSGGYKVSMSAHNDWHYGGPSSTYMVALKINTGSMQDQINQLKLAMEASFPAEVAQLETTQTQIDQLVAEALGMETGL